MTFKQQFFKGEGTFGKRKLIPSILEGRARPYFKNPRFRIVYLQVVVKVGPGWVKLCEPSPSPVQLAIPAIPSLYVFLN